MSSSSVASITLGATEILSSIGSLCALSNSLASFKTEYDFHTINVKMQKCLLKLGSDLRFFEESHYDTLTQLLPCVDNLRSSFEGAFGREKQMVKKALSALRSGGAPKDSKNEKAFHMIYDRTIGKRLTPMSLFDIDIIRNNLSLTSALLSRTIDVLLGRRDAHKAMLAEEAYKYSQRQQERHTSVLANILGSSRTTGSPRPISISGILTDSPVFESQRQGSADSAVMRSLQRLRTPDYAARHMYQQSMRAKDTCAWLLKHKDYCRWLKDGQSSILTICGPPGVGKSVLVSQVCDELFRKHSTESGFYFAYFYMGYDKIQSACDVAASLVKQLCDQSQVVPSLLRTFLNNAEMLSMPPLSTLIEVLAKLSKGFRDYDCTTCIVLDGWDEPNLTEDPGFSTLLENLCQFEWRVLITYRSHNRPPVLDSIGSIRQWPITIRPSDSKRDVRSYVTNRISNSATVRQLLPEVNEDAFKRFLNDKTELIVEKSGGIFARAGILTDSLLEQRRLKDIDTMLETTPDDLSSEYTRLLDAIQQQPEHLKVLANRTLIWLACAKKPISEKGFCQALSVANTKGNDDYDDDDLLSPKRVPQVQTVISCTKGLVTLDLGTSSILLAYYGLKDTIEEYYSERDEADSPIRQTFDSEKKLLAFTCVRYLNLRGLKEAETAIDFSKQLETSPFLSYASEFWASHVSGCGLSSIDFHRSNSIMNELHKFFSHRQRLEVVVQTASVAASPLSWYDPKTFDEINLKVRAMTDLDILLSSITANKIDIPKESRRRRPSTPGDGSPSNTADLLRIVIEYCLTPDVLDSSSSIFKAVADDPTSRKELIEAYFRHKLNPPSISEAVKENRLGAVIAWAEKLKQERGVRADPATRRALYSAIEANNLTMVETLLERGADPRSNSDNKGLALFFAITKNAHDIVQSLLEHGADISATDKAGRTVLHIAAASADGRMIDRLLAHGADINRCDDNGCTPLFDAILKNNNRVISSLIEAGVPLRAKRYSDGTTALDHAKLLNNKRAVHQLEVQMSDTSTIGDMSIRE